MAKSWAADAPVPTPLNQTFFAHLHRWLTDKKVTNWDKCKLSFRSDLFTLNWSEHCIKLLIPHQMTIYRSALIDTLSNAALLCDKLCCNLPVNLAGNNCKHLWIKILSPRGWDCRSSRRHRKSSIDAGIFTLTTENKINVIIYR